MKKLIKLVIAMGFGLFSLQANALIMLSPADCNVGVNCWVSDQNANMDAGEVAALIGYADPLTELYKQDVGAGSDTGPFSSSYATTFGPDALDPENALIEYVGGDYISCPDCFVLVKDGNQSPNQYVFDIGFWDGMMAIDLTGFWVDNGAISHVAIYGNTRANVPEPGMVALLAIGLIGLVVARRKATV